MVEQNTSLSARRAAIFGAVLFAISLLIGWRLVVDAGATSGMSRFVFLRVGLPMMVPAIVAAFLIAVFAAPRRPDPAFGFAGAALFAAVFAFAASAAAHHLIFDGFAFSMDEWMTRFQAAIFLNGRLTGAVPVEFKEFGEALFPGFAVVDEATGRVASAYRPGMAAIEAAFSLFSLKPYAGAALTAGAVWLAASVAARLLPGAEGAPLVAAIIVATSPQALFAGGTSYAMPAHLFFNLLWLRLFLSDTGPGHLAAALVGVATASLHQVHAHVFFAAPFLLSLLRPFRWRLIALYGAVYLIGHLAILLWDPAGNAAAQVKDTTISGGVGGVLTVVSTLLAWPDGDAFATAFANLSRFFGWQSLAAFPLLVFLARRAAWTPTLALVAASIATSFAPYVVLMPDQGHGWGYRYLHGLIGPFAILAAAGWAEATRRGVALGRVVAAGAVATVALSPLRADLTRAVAEPYAIAASALKEIDADVVAIETHGAFYIQDIARTDPYAAERPVAVRIHMLTPDEARALCDRFDVAVFTNEDAARAGVETFPPPPGAETPDYLAALAILTAEDCAPPR